MSEDRRIEEVRRIFANDKFSTENGAVIEEVGEHYAKCSILLNEHHKNAMGAVMGGVYFTLADFTFAVAANWQKMDTVSLNSSISYLGAAKGEKLIAEAVCIKDGKNAVFYRIEIHDGQGNLAAMVDTTGYHKSVSMPTF